MPRFRCRAVDKTGKEVARVEEGRSPLEVAARLRSEGLELTSVVPMELPPMRPSLGVSAEQLALFNSQLSAVVRSELPVGPGLKALAREAGKGKFRRAIEDVISEVEAGASLREAISKRQDVFPAIYPPLIDAGVASGNLPAVLDMLTDYYEKMASLRRRVIEALTYPAIVIVFAVALAMYLGFVMAPAFAGFTADFMMAGADVVSALSRMPRDIAWAASGIACLVAVLAIIASIACRSWRGRVLVDKARLGFPVIGRLLKSYRLAHFTRALGLMVKAGVPLTEALRLVSGAAGSPAMDEALGQIQSEVSSGRAFSESLDGQRMFPRTLVWMISTGEKRGRLDEALLELAELYEQRAQSLAEWIKVLSIPFGVALTVGVVWPILRAVWGSLGALMKALGASAE